MGFLLSVSVHNATKLQSGRPSASGLKLMQIALESVLVIFLGGKNIYASVPTNRCTINLATFSFCIETITNYITHSKPIVYM